MNLTTTLSKLACLLIDRFWLGFSTIPTYGDWSICLCALTVYTLVALLFGIWTGFLRWNLQSSGLTIVKVTITSFIAPALLEEFFFRAMLLPHPNENTGFDQIAIWSIFGLFSFIVYHPLNGLTFFSAGRKTFSNPIFLTLASLLGLACTTTYLYTGSIWIPVVIHWLTLVIWLLCWGGIEQLQLDEH